MSADDTKYVRITKGGFTNAQLVPANQNLYKHILSKKLDHYHSVYDYSAHHKKHFDKERSVQGITDVTTHRLLWDFDSGNLEEARQDTLTLCERLIEKGVNPDDIRVAFSGNKGMHCEIITKLAFNRKEYENIIYNLAGDLKTLDWSMTDENQLIRMAFTKHQKSGLYKIPLSYKDLKEMSIEEITKAAESIDGYDMQAYAEENFVIDLPTQVEELKAKQHPKAKKEISKETTLLPKADFSDVDFNKCPKWLDKAKYALLEGCFFGSQSTDVGERNTAFMILCATFRAQGLSRDHTKALLIETAEKQAKRTGEEPYTEDQLEREILSTVYNTGWKGGQYGKDEPLLLKVRERMGLENQEIDTYTESIESVGLGFRDYAKNINNNRIFLGLESFDKNILMSVGSLVSVVSAPGGGKTALGNLFAETVSAGGEDVLYFSLDLYKNILFGRLLQRHINLDIKDILYEFESGNPDQTLVSAYSEVLSAYSNVFFRFRSASIEDIEADIKKHIHLRGKTPKLIIVDYLDKVRTQYSDPTHSSAAVAGFLSDIAKKYECLVLLMCQPSKMGSAGPNEPFKSYRSMKGSSSIESESRLVLGVHREGFDPTNDGANDVYSSITVLKNNAGPLMRLDYAWNGMAGTFNELSSEQRRDLNRLRKEKEEAAKKSDDWDI